MLNSMKKAELHVHLEGSIEPAALMEIDPSLTREEIAAGFLSVIDPNPAATGQRSALAAWIASPENPLTARVIVNRLWHHHFGRGIVATPSDFGTMGDPPTHPKLLDWLASELVRGGWKMKPLHRMILTSSAYRQASGMRPEAAKVDPDNKLFWRFPRQRLEAEVIRDAELYAAGMLNLKMGGPSIFPEVPPGMQSRGGWKVTEDPAERNRPSIYVFVRRNTRYPMFEAFDLPDQNLSCGRRNVSTVPTQALMLLNDWAWADHDRALGIA